MKFEVSGIFFVIGLLFAVAALTGCNKGRDDKNMAVVYVAGVDGKSVVLWENGVMQNLAQGTEDYDILAYSVYMSGKDVYVAEIYNYCATL